MFQIELPIDLVIAQYKDIIAGMAEDLAIAKARAAFFEQAILKMESGETIVSGPSDYSNTEEATAYTEEKHDHTDISEYEQEGEGNGN